MADPATQLRSTANQNSARSRSSAVTRPRSAANQNSPLPGQRPGTMSTPVEHPRTFLCPQQESAGPCNRRGIHIIQTLDEMPGVRLLNNGEPTHRDGGRLDLSFISEELCEGSIWEVHPTLTSDHFAVQTSLMLRKMPPPPPPPKRWNHSKADWPKFQHSINEWIATYRPAEDIDQLEKDFVETLQNAADASIPIVVPTSHQHKDNWYYCPEIKELNALMNRVRKIF